MSTPRSDLATGDNIFLGFLLWGPASAYDIKKAMAMSVSHFWSAAHSQVYQQASRLLRDGYIKEREAPGARRKRILSLTPKGRRAVGLWLRTPSSLPELRNEALAKLFFAAHGDPKKTRAMLLDQRDHAKSELTTYEGIRKLLERSDDPEARFQLMTLRLGIGVARAYLNWVDSVLRDLGKG
ncbi:MAG: PadR family transcriptional regulator [Actinomycetota bacterium]